MTCVSDKLLHVQMIMAAALGLPSRVSDVISRRVKLDKNPERSVRLNGCHQSHPHKESVPGLFEIFGVGKAIDISVDFVRPWPRMQDESRAAVAMNQFRCDSKFVGSGGRHRRVARE